MVDGVRPDRKILLNQFWGEETYDTTDFLVENADFVHPELVNVLAASSDDTVSSLFSSPLTPEGKLSGVEGEGHSQTGSQQSLSNQFKHWLAATVTCLMTRE